MPATASAAFNRWCHMMCVCLPQVRERSRGLWENGRRASGNLRQNCTTNMDCFNNKDKSQLMLLNRREAHISGMNNKTPSKGYRSIVHHGKTFGISTPAYITKLPSGAALLGTIPPSVRAVRFFLGASHPTFGTSCREETEVLACYPRAYTHPPY